MTGANAKIKRILVRQNGVEKQVRPDRAIEVDFTTGYHDFTYLGSSRSNAASQGRNDTHGLYITYNSTSNIQGYFSVPNTITSQGDIYKIEFNFYSEQTGNGGGFYSNATSNWKDSPSTYVRFWYNGIDIYNGGAGSGTVVELHPSGGYTATIDLEGLKCYTSHDSEGVVSIPSAYAEAYKTLWSNGTACLGIGKGGNSGTAYLEKVKFYIK